MVINGIRTNCSSLHAQRRLAEATKQLESTYEQLSSGLRINGAFDDAAGLAISKTLQSNAKVFSKALHNLNDGMSLLNIADSALDSLLQITNRLQELAQQSANGTYSSAQRKALDEEAQALSSEYFRISRSTSFNHTNLFDGSLGGGLFLQAGYGSEGAFQTSVGGHLGTGEFGQITTFGPAATIYDLTTADFNNDGNLDVIAAGDGRVTLRFGDGTGNIGSAVIVIPLEPALSVSVGDINSDGNLDLAAVDTTGTTSVTLGRGDGTFSSPTDWSGNVGMTYSVELADLNNDTRLDLIIGGDADIEVRFGNGDGTFGSGSSYGIGTAGGHEIKTGDFNNDGFLDVVSTNQGYVSIGINDGTGRLIEGSTYGTAGDTQSEITVGDLNGDGVLDLFISGCDVGNSIGVNSVHFGTGDGAFGGYIAATPNVVEVTTYVATLADINGDNRVDLVGASNSGTYVALGNGNGTFLATTSTPSTSFSEPYSIALADLTNDSVPDLIVGGSLMGVSAGETRDGISPLASFSLQSRAGSLQALSEFNKVQTRLSNQRGEIGAYQSRLSYDLASLQAKTESLTGAASRITDVDVAEQSARLVRLQILQQASTAVLAQANQQPRLLLGLLQSA